jgi:tetratricopeptide (TPR) repeat protein
VSTISLFGEAEEPTVDLPMVAASGTGPAIANDGGVAISGAIAGDVNVTVTTIADRFRVEAWPTAAPLEVVGWRRQPSRLLAAAHEVVPFGFRDTELAELAAWRDRIEWLAARLAYGPGGQGKTRLAARFATDSAAAGWTVARARHCSDRATVAAVPVDQVGQAQGLLVVVDYAERWPAGDLLDLFAHPLLRQGVPTKVLLLARPAGWWRALRHRLGQLGVIADDIPLSPLAPDPATRAEVFQTAVDRFIAPDLYHLCGKEVDRPAGLDNDNAYKQVLVIHMAALAAVDAADRGGIPPDEPGGLSSYLLAREREHWRLFHAERPHSGYATTPDVMARTVYTAILTRAQPYEPAVAALDRVGIASSAEAASRILDDHALCYPAAKVDTVLEPLYPDRLAEDFLALLTPGHADSAAVDAWAATAAARLLVPAPDGSLPAHAPAAMTMLVETARRWPHVASRLLYPLLRTYPRLGLAASGAELARLAEIDDLPPDVLEAIDVVLPIDRHVDLDVAAAALAARLTPYRLATATDPSQQAELYNVLAIRLHHGGQTEQAFVPAKQVVDIYRGLVAVQPGHESDLVLALNNLGTILSDLGRRDEALAAATEAVDIYRRVVAVQPGHESDLALALNNLGTILSDLGRRDEALAAATEAVDIYRQLAAANPAEYAPYLARGLNNLSVYLSDGGREAALSATIEALDIRLRLAAVNPATFEPDLAATLSNLGVRQSQLGRRQEALFSTTKAVEIWRRLAAANPAAHEPDLALALNNLGADLSDVGRRGEALAVAAEAVDIYRRLAGTNLAAHESNLAAALINLGIRLSHLGRHEEALGVSTEAVGLRRRLAAASRVYEPDLAAGLHIFGIRLSRVLQWEEAFAAATEAVAKYRRLAETTPAAYNSILARALNDLGAPLANLGRSEEALAATTEALEIWRRLAAADRAHQPDLAAALVNAGVRLSNLGERGEALAVVMEAVKIYRRLAELNPAAHEPDLAAALSIAGVRWSNLGKRGEALAVVTEAVKIYRQLAEANPAAHEPDLAAALKDLSAYLSYAGQYYEAFAATAEVVAIYRRLAMADPSAHEPNLGAALLDFARVRAEWVDELPQAQVAAQEAVLIYSVLAHQRPQVVAQDLRIARETLAKVLSRLGWTASAINVQLRTDKLAVQIDDGREGLR